MTDLLSRYQEALKTQALQADAGQMAAIRYLNNVQKALNNKCAQELKSVYIHGPVGRGKSMVMNLFCRDLTVMFRRVHFHAFMEELHSKLHSYSGKEDAMTVIARDIGCDARVLCFDEFYITNIADAMLLGRLFEKLFAENVLVVATSNWGIEDLFQGGVNRAQFMPFIKLMHKRMDVIELAGGLDYRTKNIKNMKSLPYYFFVDNYAETAQSMADYFAKFTVVGAPSPALPDNLQPIKSAGRIAWFSFKYLCDQNLGREEYLNLATHVDTILLESVPLFSSAEADAALRFITLIDILYENKVRLICSAADVPQALCLSGDAAAPFARTASRIMEMQGW